MDDAAASVLKLALPLLVRHPDATSSIHGEREDLVEQFGRILDRQLTTGEVPDHGVVAYQLVERYTVRFAAVHDVEYALS